jgi:hypothetical protein
MRVREADQSMWDVLPEMRDRVLYAPVAVIVCDTSPFVPRIGQSPAEGRARLSRRGLGAATRRIDEFGHECHPLRR